MKIRLPAPDLSFLMAPLDSVWKFESVQVNAGSECRERRRNKVPVPIRRIRAWLSRTQNQVCRSSHHQSMAVHTVFRQKSMSSSSICPIRGAIGMIVAMGIGQNLISSTKTGGSGEG
jgi:hypothetical protein